MESITIKTKTSFDEFKGMLENIEENDIWETRFEKDLKVKVDDGDFKLCTGDEEYAIHSLGIPSILDRAGVKGILSSSLLKPETEDKELLATVINLGLGHFGDKSCTVLIREGSIMAVHGSQYSIMLQSEGMGIINDALLSRFENAEFVEGSFTYEHTPAVYRVARPGDDLFSEYEKAWKTAGLSTRDLNQTSAYVKVDTSDVGESCFSLTPYLVIKNKWMPLSKSLQVKHRGKNEAAMLKTCVNNCFSVFSESFSKEIPKLMTMTLTYPQQALVRIITKLGINLAGSLGLAENLIQSFERKYDTYSTTVNEYGVTVPSDDRDILTAFDVYCFFLEMQYSADFLKLSEMTRVRIIEKLYTIPGLDWEKLDQDGSRYL